MLGGDIEIAMDTESDQSWYIVRIPLVFKAEAFDRFPQIDWHFASSP